MDNTVSSFNSSINYNDIKMNICRKVDCKLYFRNLNTIRAIARDHNDPIDRFVVMAQSASRGQFVSPETGIAAKISGYKAVLYFEFILW